MEVTVVIKIKYVFKQISLIAKNVFKVIIHVLNAEMNFCWV